MSPPVPAPAWAMLALLFAVPLLLPFARSVEAPILIAAVVGVVALIRRPSGLFDSSATRSLLLALGAYCAAALISAVVLGLIGWMAGKGLLIMGTLDQSVGLVSAV